jgi:CheY-like chemotaxis protein
MKLLIIDDDNISNFVNTRVAQKSGLFNEIRSVSNGKDALEIFIQACKGTAAAPDVVLLDLNMPVMNGFDFMTELKRLTFPKKESLNIVILTSSDNPIDIDQAHAMGIKHYLVKSITLKDLQDTIFSLYNKGPTPLKDDSDNEINAGT